MRVILGLLLVLCFSVQGHADSLAGMGDAFAQCSGDHHGSYLDFYTNQDGSVIKVEVSTDGESQKWPVYTVQSMDIYGKKVAPISFNKTINDVIAAMNDSKLYHDFVMVEAIGPKKSKMHLNLNKWNGDSFLVIDGYVEPLKCNIIQH